MFIHFVSATAIKPETHLYPNFVWYEADMVYRKVQHCLYWIEQIQEHFCGTERKPSEFEPDTQRFDMAHFKIYWIIDFA
jgi:hypothetical protein